MNIVGIEGLDGRQLALELKKGARFVVYQYCMSFIVITFKRPSNVYFIRAGEGAITNGLGFSLISLLLGFWGLPWGPIYTFQSLATNFDGGIDVTPEVLAHLGIRGQVASSLSVSAPSVPLTARRSGYAIAAGYLGLVSILMIFAPFALLFGVLGVIDIKKNGIQSGMGRAIFGIVMGAVFTLPLLVAPFVSPRAPPGHQALAGGETPMFGDGFAPLVIALIALLAITAIVVFLLRDRNPRRRGSNRGAGKARGDSSVGDDFQQLLDMGAQHATGSAQNKGSSTVSARPEARLLTAAQLMAEAKRLETKRANWPEILAALNPSNMKDVTDLLMAIRGPHMFAPGVAMRVIQVGCEYVLRSNGRAGCVEALQAAQRSVDKIIDSERY